MIFPVSVLPATVVAKELFNHLCMCLIALVTLLLCGHTPQLSWIQVIYYMFATFCISEAFALILSVLNMLARDVHKWVVSITRMLFYFTPLIWNCEFSNYPMLTKLMKLNPYYYLVTGYRDSVFYNIGFWEHKYMTGYFWLVTLILFAIGCSLMYKYRDKFMNLK
jgi:teichoic acid transport system permease protein